MVLQGLGRSGLARQRGPSREEVNGASTSQIRIQAGTCWVGISPWDSRGSRMLGAGCHRSPYFLLGGPPFTHSPVEWTIALRCSLLVDSIANEATDCVVDGSRCWIWSDRTGVVCIHMGVCAGLLRDPFGIAHSHLVIHPWMHNDSLRKWMCSVDKGNRMLLRSRCHVSLAGPRSTYLCGEIRRMA